jgi:hypothetical protein
MPVFAEAVIRGTEAGVDIEDSERWVRLRDDDDGDDDLYNVIMNVIMKMEVRKRFAYYQLDGDNMSIVVSDIVQLREDVVNDSLPDWFPVKYYNNKVLVVDGEDNPAVTRSHKRRRSPDTTSSSSSSSSNSSSSSYSSPEVRRALTTSDRSSSSISPLEARRVPPACRSSSSSDASTPPTTKVRRSNDSAQTRDGVHGSEQNPLIFYE